uniref:DUF4372 domain-containing protein n=1 Tax=Prevotella corporis TaxID=28128 RepID=UPI0012E351F3
MYKDKYVFAQLVSFLDRNHFNYLVRKYGGDKYVKFFSCWNQLLTLIFTPVRDKGLLRIVPIAHSFQCAQAVPRGYSRRNSMQPMPHKDS